LVWQEKDVDKSRLPRLVVEWAKFVSHVMLSAGHALWQIRKTAFHFSKGKRKWQTLP